MQPEPVREGAGRVVVAETDVAFAIVDQASGELIAYASERGALRFARLMDVLWPDARQLEVLLGELEGVRLLRTIELRYAAVCFRCGAFLAAGELARWNSVTGLVRHLRRCPTRITAGGRE
jgi:hypothetical protein